MSTQTDLIVQDILDNSVTIDSADFTATDKRDLIDALFPTGVMFHYQDTKLEVGDRVFFKESDAIFPDFQGTAIVSSLPGDYPTTLVGEANLTEIRKS